MGQNSIPRQIVSSHITIRTLALKGCLAAETCNVNIFGANILLKPSFGMDHLLKL